MTFTALMRFLGVRGMIAIGFALAFGFVAWRADTFSARLERSRDALAMEKSAHAVTKASLNNLEQRLAVFIADGDRRAEAAARALREQRERSAALDAQIARLRSQAPTAGELERCETPATVRRLEGL